MEHEIVLCGIPFGTDKEKEALAYVRENGFTSIQVYTYWNKFEPEKRGIFDWSFYDRVVGLIKEAGLRFVPFFLMGPLYAAPEWWMADEGHKGLVCLEHNKTCPIESIWNPHFRYEISRVLKAFADHYLPWDVIESVQPGICGDYGEALFPALGNWPGAYHTHRGYWCGGSDAVEAFRQGMKHYYVTIDHLNHAWHSSYGSFEEIKPFLRHMAPSRTAYLDLLRWYNASMDEYSDFWMKECRKYFPDYSIYLCTGGMEEPENGSSFAGQAKAAARHNGGIRLTNEGNSFYDNFYLTVNMYSACRYYGAYLGLEPVGPMLPRGVTSRMFGTAAYGNRQIFHYYTNLVQDGVPNGTAEIVKKYASLVHERKADTALAFLWPLDQSVLEGRCIPENIKTAVSFLRKHYELMVLSEDLILDGALDSIKLFVMLDVNFTRGAVLEKIARWVCDGGVVLSNTRTVDIEGDSVESFDNVFGMNKDSEEAWGHCDYYPTGVPWTGRLNSIPSIHAEKGWLGLSDSVVQIARNRAGMVKNSVNMCSMPVEDASCCFENTCGKGKGIFYSSWLHLDAKADEIFTPSKAFEYLLHDCCEQFSGTRKLDTREDEVARTRIGDKCYALTGDGILEVTDTCAGV